MSENLAEASCSQLPAAGHFAEPCGRHEAPAAVTGTAPARYGHGRAFASFGEIVQGRLSDGEDFLVTLPIDLWSSCSLVCRTQDGPSQVDGGQAKSRQVAEALLAALGLERGVRIQLDQRSSIPVGKGLSSSTADMLAVVRAFQDALGLLVTEEFVSRLFTAIEPHDGLHYPMCVAYNHRAGRLLRRLNHIPRYRIVAVDAGGEVCTREYNRRLQFSPHHLRDYDRLFDDLLAAFARRDDTAIAACAQRSTELHIERTGNRFLGRLAERAIAAGALGILTTHSGTCGGCLLPGDAPDRLLERVEAAVAGTGHLFRTKTLPMLG